MDDHGTKGLCATVTEEILEQLRHGIAPWQRPWTGTGAIRWPSNAATGRVYRGINFLTLLSGSATDPRWCTRRQAEKRGWTVRDGAERQRVYFYAFVPRRTARGLAAGYFPVLRTSEVFHASDLDGLPPAGEAIRLPEGWSAVDAADRILKASGAVIFHGGDRAAYDLRRDVIYLPHPAGFATPADYYGTALHELAHWTGHDTRLDRHKFFCLFGTPGYAREELRAELASAMLAVATGIPHDPRGHANYVGDWLTALERDQREIFRAASDAQRIVDYVLAFDQQARARLPVYERKVAGAAADGPPTVVAPAA